MFYFSLQLNSICRPSASLEESLSKQPVFLSINCTDPYGNTALHTAAYRGRKEVAVLLLQHGIDPTIKNKRGENLLLLFDF